MCSLCSQPPGILFICVLLVVWWSTFISWIRLANVCPSRLLCSCRLRVSTGSASVPRCALEKRTFKFHSSIRHPCRSNICHFLARTEDKCMEMDEEEERVLVILTNHLWLRVWGLKHLFLTLLGFMYFPVAARTLSQQSAKWPQRCQALNLTCSGQTGGFCGSALHVFLLC